MKQPSKQEKIYWARINKALDYIESNLEKQFTLDELAEVANFSKYHFHRIFVSMIGETPFQFILRVRLERAASLLVTSREESITSIAYQCGFTDTSIFSRNFKYLFKQSASKYRISKFKISNLSQEEGKETQDENRSIMYFSSQNNLTKKRTNMKLNQHVEVKELPKMTVAYIRYIGPYKGDSKLFESLWNRLFAWAGPRGLIGGEDFKSLIMYHDDPNVTDEDKLRMSVCISVAPATKVDGEIGKMEIESANYLMARFVVDETQFEEAWQWVYGSWLPKNGYQPDDKPCFEMYPEEPKDGKFTVDICVPIVPL